MHDCWQDNPENRPTFTQIRETLETIMQKDNPYLDLTAVEESHVEYNVRCFDRMAEESDDDQRDDNVEVVCHEGMQDRLYFRSLELTYCTLPLILLYIPSLQIQVET